MDERKLKISFNKSGGTAGKGGVTTRVTLPKTWIDKMEITQEEREVTVTFDGEKIIITR
jgi:hypothetical protein